MLFLVAIDILRHSVFSEQLHTIPGFLSIYAVIAAAVTAFSYTTFGLIQRLYQQTTRQNRQLAALNSIAKVSAGRLRHDELLATNLDHILSVMTADAGLICLVDIEKEEHSLVCARGFSEELQRRIRRAKLKDDPIAQEVVRTGRPVIIENVLDNPSVAQAAKAEGIRSAISTPLKSEGEALGILVVASHKERPFTSVDKEFLEGIGGQLGLAIRNAILYEQAQRRNRELGALLAVGKVATSSMQLDELLGASLDTVLEVTSTDAAELWLTEDSRELVMQCHRGAHREAFLERTRFSIGEGIPGLVAQSQELIVTHDLMSDARFLRQKVTKAGFRTFCALPVRYQSKLVGVMTVAAFSPDALRGKHELRLLESIGEWLALAIENARLYRQMQDLAVIQERERIAREMHDGIAQLLGYVNTQTIAVNKFISNGEFELAQEELAKMQDIARDLYSDVREGILALRTATQRRKGLVGALLEYVERFREMSGLQVEVEVSPDAANPALNPSTEIQLMRIVQEALTNVRKHSRATTTALTFQRNGDHLQVTIADNGQGFDLARLPTRGWPRFGLQTMRERAQSVGGTLQIETAPGQGTRVLVRVPVSSGETEG
jgi:nitrate/nitrite-specific signal transduction histidine kinase